MGGIEGSRGTTLDLLLIEDNPSHAALVRRALQRCDQDVRVEHVGTGAAARTHLLDPRGWFDLVLLDLKLPDCSGHDVLREVKTDPARRGMPVVVLTTSDAHRDWLRAAQANANSYLVKPSGYRELVRLLQTTLDYWAHCHHRPRTEERDP